jgi:hypothetical protein
MLVAAAQCQFVVIELQEARRRAVEILDRMNAFRRPVAEMVDGDRRLNTAERTCRIGSETVIEAEQAQNCRVEIADVIEIDGGAHTPFVGRALNVASLEVVSRRPRRNSPRDALVSSRRRCC